MIRDGFVSCDVCSVHMGQLWNQPAAARDLLPSPDFRVCDDCFLNSELHHSDSVLEITHSTWTAS